MKKIITYIILLAILIAVDYSALSGLGAPAVAAHRREFMSQFFTGNAGDWIGLILFHLNLLVFAWGVTKEPEFYEEVGSSFWGVVIFFALPIIWIALIYIC